MHAERHGARQPERFDPAKASQLDDPARFAYLPVEAVAELLDLPQKGLLVDFGAGTGAYAIRLALIRPDVEVAALDEQTEMLARLKANLGTGGPKNVRAVLAGSAELAALRGRADRILALNVLHELGDKAVSELAALLKKDGRAVFIDWNAQAERPVGPPKDHLYSPAQAQTRLARFGARVLAERAFPYHYALVASF